MPNDFIAAGSEGAMSDLTTIRGFARRAVVCGLSYAACVLFTGARRDPEFMRYDAAARRVDLTIIAAFDQSNTGYNLNGASHGAHRITVPSGWRVTVSFVNRDVFRHSIAVIREVRSLPLRITKPVFSGAASRAPDVGLPPGARQDDIGFVADRPGAYLLACGVPGHAVLGSYLRLTVSSVDSVPRYEMVAPSQATIPQ